MGCATSSTAKSVPEESSKPKPRIFALVRYGHDVIRCDLDDLLELIKAGDISSALKHWERHKKWIALHERMEEGGDTEAGRGMFRLLDDLFGGVASDAKLSELHDELHKKQEALETAFADQDLTSLTKAFNEYHSQCLRHLEKEESIMMPRITQMMKEGHDVFSYMKNDILSLVVDHPDFQHFIQFANIVLEKHSEGLPKVRVFDHALWTVATAAQWKEWERWIQEAVSPETFRDVRDAISASGTPAASIATTHKVNPIKTSTNTQGTTSTSTNFAKPVAKSVATVPETVVLTSEKIASSSAQQAVAKSSSTKPVPKYVSVRSGML